MTASAAILPSVTALALILAASTALVASLAAVTFASVILAVVTELDFKLAASITSSGIASLVLDNIPTYITKLSLCNDPESQVTFTVVLDEKDELDIVMLYLQSL